MHPVPNSKAGTPAELRTRKVWRPSSKAERPQSVPKRTTGAASPKQLAGLRPRESSVTDPVRRTGSMLSWERSLERPGLSDFGPLEGRASRGVSDQCGSALKAEVAGAARPGIRAEPCWQFRQRRDRLRTTSGGKSCGSCGGSRDCQSARPRRVATTWLPSQRPSTRTRLPSL